MNSPPTPSQPSDTITTLFLDLIHTNPSPPTQQLPSFSSDRINYILVFSGSFNPPHIGHVNFLRDSFLTARRDLNVVAALFEPRSDAFLEGKCGVAGLILLWRCRADMLATDERLRDWAWVLDEGCGKLEVFKREARDCDVRVRYLKLRSAETELELRGRSLGLDRVFDGIIVNTCGRKGHDALNAWGLGGAQWTRLHDHADKVQRYRMMLQDKGAARWGLIWAFTRGDEEKRSLISSTEVRQLAEALTEQEMEDHGVLSKVVVGWDLLRLEQNWVVWQKMATDRQLCGTSADVCTLKLEIEAALLLERQESVC